MTPAAPKAAVADTSDKEQFVERLYELFSAEHGAKRASAWLRLFERYGVALVLLILLAGAVGVAGYKVAVWSAENLGELKDGHLLYLREESANAKTLSKAVETLSEGVKTLGESSQSMKAVQERQTEVLERLDRGQDTVIRLLETRPMP